jgi:hypothetical protein
MKPQKTEDRRQKAEFRRQKREGGGTRHFKVRKNIGKNGKSV